MGWGARPPVAACFWLPLSGRTHFEVLSEVCVITSFCLEHGTHVCLLGVDFETRNPLSWTRMSSG